MTRKLICLRTARVWQHQAGDQPTDWVPYPADSAAEALALCEREHPLVGLVLLDMAPNSAVFAEIESLLRRTGGDMVWVGLVTDLPTGPGPLQDLLVNYLFDFHTLPVDSHRLLTTLGHALGMARLRQAGGGVARLAACEHGHLLGESPAMRQVFAQLAKLATVDSSVMLLGESGTGKELAARLIHQTSLRAKGPFVAVNCGAIPASLIQSELFGHEKGAFTGACRRQIGQIEAAHGGTLFLDEIGDLPADLQANLLRFLQERSIVRVGGSDLIRVDVRVIAATHRDLPQAVAQGDFRQDLFFRLCVLDLTLPPLRQRGQDVALLAQHYLTSLAPRLNPRVQGFSDRAMQQMQAYSWPGNVRELINRVERALVLTEGRLIGPQDLGLEVAEADLHLPTLAEARARADQQAVQAALDSCGHRVELAAKQLGISRGTLYRMLDKYKGEL